MGDGPRGEAKDDLGSVYSELGRGFVGLAAGDDSRGAVARACGGFTLPLPDPTASEPRIRITSNATLPSIWETPTREAVVPLRKIAEPGPRRLSATWAACDHPSAVRSALWVAYQANLGILWIVGVELAKGAISLARVQPARERTVVLLGHEITGVPEEHVDAADLCVGEQRGDGRDVIGTVRIGRDAQDNTVHFLADSPHAERAALPLCGSKRFKPRTNAGSRR
jgi:hypothetical protein